MLLNAVGKDAHGGSGNEVRSGAATSASASGPPSTTRFVLSIEIIIKNRNVVSARSLAWGDTWVTHPGVRRRGIRRRACVMGCCTRGKGRQRADSVRSESLQRMPTPEIAAGRCTGHTAATKCGYAPIHVLAEAVRDKQQPREAFLGTVLA